MIYSTVLLPCLRVAFIGTLLVFFITWFSKKILSLIWRKSYEPKDEGYSKQTEAEYNIKQDAWKQVIQEKYLEKAAKYKEDVLVPREKKKKERTEKEFYKHFGPLWSGEGSKLGGEDGISDDETNENRQAARRRQLPESEMQTTVRYTKPQNKPKRVIELPEEPDELDPESVVVTLRTPISTIVKRRFHLSHSFQNVLDFMTKTGFGQHCHQLCTSFPRQVLSPDPEVPLSELGFGKRVTLNIEDKTDDD